VPQQALRREHLEGQEVQAAHRRKARKALPPAQIQ